MKWTKCPGDPATQTSVSQNISSEYFSIAFRVRKAVTNTLAGLPARPHNPSTKAAESEPVTAPASRRLILASRASNDYAIKRATGVGERYWPVSARPATMSLRPTPGRKKSAMSVGDGALRMSPRAIPCSADVLVRRLMCLATLP